MHKRGEFLTAIAYEKTLRMENNPRKSAVDKVQSIRLKTQNNWREEAKRTIARIGLDNFPRELITPLMAIPPNHLLLNISFHPKLAEEISHHEDPMRKKWSSKKDIGTAPTSNCKSQRRHRSWGRVDYQPAEERRTFNNPQSLQTPHWIVWNQHFAQNVESKKIPSDIA